MGILNDFERRLEGAVEGIFTKVFRTGLHPVELATQILKEMETHKTVGVRTVWVPNHFLFRLSEADAARFRDTQKAMRSELEHVVEDGARERGWGLVGPPEVEFEADAGLKEGSFLCEASLVEGPTGWTQAVRAEAAAPATNGAASAAPGSALLTVVADGVPGKSYSLEKDRVVIGRLPENDVVLTDPGASREHADPARGWRLRRRGPRRDERDPGQRPSRGGARAGRRRPHHDREHGARVPEGVRACRRSCWTS